MSEINEAKKAFQEASKDLEKEKQEKLKEKIKAIIHVTLEKIESYEEQIKEKQKDLSVLKKDLRDLESGRLDLIEERQKADPETKKVSIIIVERIREVHTKPWYDEYVVLKLDQNNYSTYFPVSPIIMTGTHTTETYGATCCESFESFVDTASLIAQDLSQAFNCTGSNFSSFAPGTYSLRSGRNIDIRPFGFN